MKGMPEPESCGKKFQELAPYARTLNHCGFRAGGSSYAVAGKFSDKAAKCEMTLSERMSEMTSLNDAEEGKRGIIPCLRV